MTTDADSNGDGDGDGKAAEGEGAPWWHAGVVYQIYVRSFADSNGDGIGDLQGVIDHLDHVASLGVDAIWLSPITASPNADWGYDVADYCKVDPDYGDMATLDRLIAEAGKRNIRVLLDLVPNHTSDRHPWFQDARTGPAAEHRDWYIWADPRPGIEDGPPNNWVSSFAGPAWSLDEASGQYFLHSFTPEQVDLNWRNDDVRAAFEDILSFWWSRGVAGFRIDVCHQLIKDSELRDNPPATEDDPWIQQIFGQRPLYNSNRPEVHEIMKQWRKLADSYDVPRVLIGETSLDRVEEFVTFYGSGKDELHLAFNFVFLEAPFEAETMRNIVERTEALLPSESVPVWTGSNHDISRLATRWAGGDPAKVRLALFILVTLRGAVVFYQGDEIGLIDGELTKDDLLDPVGQRFWPYYPGRDPCRTPMPWNDDPGRGFTDPGVETWLPMTTPQGLTVEAQRDDPESVLHYFQALVRLRSQLAELRTAPYGSLETRKGVWAFSRGNVVVAGNFGDESSVVDEISGTIQFRTSQRLTRDATSGNGERLGNGTGHVKRLELGPWEGVALLT